MKLNLIKFSNILKFQGPSKSQNLRVVLCVVACGTFGAQAFAVDEQVEKEADKPIGAIVESKDGLPCLKLSVTCKKFVKDSKGSDKSLTTQSCVDDLIAGKNVEGLTVDQNILEQCKKVRNQLKTR